MSRLRIDEALVARGLYPSRARARDAVLRGTVTVNGLPARKPSQGISESDQLSLQDEAQRYVSRAALKLIHALDHFKIDVAGRHCIDIGASTGGFTQVLLERGAKQVIAIDVGHGQMAVQDERIHLREGVNARDLTLSDVPRSVSLITCDVSFIPLSIALGPALEFAASDTILVALIKPQFEVGKDGIGRGGLVRAEIDLGAICQKVEAFIRQNHWQVQGVIPSPLEGGDGNQEYLLVARK